jgi:hypothetical protein
MQKSQHYKFLIGTSILLLTFHALIFSKFTIDDAYITFTYAKNLVQGNGPVFAPGNYIEATSSMLWAFLLSPFEFFFQNGAIAGSKILGAASLIGTQIIGVFLTRELLRNSPFVYYANLLFSFLLAGTSSFVVWGTYGMENGLVALLLTSSTWLYLKEYRTGQGYASAFLIFLLETVRPEGFIYILIFTIFRFLFFPISTEKDHAKWAFYWTKILTGCLIIYEGAGLYYFGHLMPNTVQAKVGWDLWGRILSGTAYLTTVFTLPYIILFTASGCLFFIFLRTQKKSKVKSAIQIISDEVPMIILFSIIFVHLIFVAFVGGDWMPNARFLSHLTPLILIFFVVAVFRVFQQQWIPITKSQKTAGYILSVCALSTFFGMNAILSMISYQSQAALQIAEERALSGMAFLLNKISSGKETTVACSDIGRMGYYFKGTVIDWWGLADEEIASTNQALGNIDPATILRRKPDFIVLYSNEPVLQADTIRENMAIYSRSFFENPDFTRNYEQIDSLLFWEGRWHILFQRRPDN